MPHDTPLLTTMAGAFLVAFVLGVVAQKLRLSPIVGYLLAGIVLSPRTPTGISGDVDIARQLAEVGVILLMFGVGLHFHVKDLIEVKGIALPGALIQSTVATVLGFLVGRAFGWSTAEGIVLGVALSVASTVVLLRGLESLGLVSTPAGHVAIGWLIVEDILTVIVLVAIPAMGGVQAGAGGTGLMTSLALALLRLVALVAVVFLVGGRVVPWALVQVANLRSRELFTLSVLAMAVAIATGAAVFFGASMALGAFLAGMVVGQSPVSQQAAADALPMRDAFAVLFFVSVGMLFEPSFLVQEPWLLVAGLAVVLVGKPLAALAVVALLGYSTRTALVVAMGLAQIGEFSFIVGDLARHYDLVSDRTSNLIVACALVSISLNPLLLRAIEPLEAFLRRRPTLWRWLNATAMRRSGEANKDTVAAVADAGKQRLAVIVGYGPVGQAVDRVLREAGVSTVVIDLNMDTVAEITSQGRHALFGDASHRDILAQAGLRRASHLVVTLPHSVNRAPLVAAARQISPDCQILVRARYLRERADLAQVGTTTAVFEELEAAVSLTARVLADLGGSPEQVAEETDRVRREILGTAEVL